MTILFFDTETTGLVDSRMPPGHESQPHLVQLAAVLRDDTGIERAAVNLIIKPDGWTIPEKAASIHGITTEIATANGVGLRHALVIFVALARRASVVVAHNLDFDEAVILTASKRLAPDFDPFGTQQRFCTMKAAVPILKLPHAKEPRPGEPDKYKWPSLRECIHFFFGEEMTGAHQALADVRACMRVYDAIHAAEIGA
jgi:DNA polymerase III subunit epsilon